MSLFLLIIIIMGFGLMISFGFEIGFKNQINDFAAQKYYNKGLHVQAEKLFEYIEKYPKLVNEQTLIYRGRNLLALNRTQEGTKLLKKELALEEIKLEQEPDNLLLLLMIAKIYSYLDKKDKADKYYHKALDNEYSKLNLELSQFDERFARLTLGDIYLEIGKYTKAISEYEMANSLSSNDLEYRELKIRIYHCQNKLYNN